MHDHLIDALAAAPDTVADLVAMLGYDALHAHPVDGEWSVVDIVGHIRAADAIWHPRVLMALVHDGITVPDVDEREMQRVLKSGLDFSKGITTWSFARLELVSVLRALTEDDWSHVCVHSQRGEMAVVDLCSVLERHEREHIDQLRDAIDALTESFTPE